MSFLWTSKQLLEALEGRAHNRMPDGITGISIDSRTLNQGDAFFALHGNVMDGHAFIDVAYALGAHVCIVEEKRVLEFSHCPVAMIGVDNSFRALERLGLAARHRTGSKIIAVTGSVGKTSTKDLIARVLSGSGKVHAAPKSFNNHWGVPFTLASMPMDTDYAVLELGMNHSGEIRSLVHMVRPHIAFITKVGSAHLEHFPDEHAIACAKAEIFEAVEPEGCVLLNYDDPNFEILHKAARALRIKSIFTFGRNPHASFCLKTLELKETYSSIVVDIDGKEFSACVGCPGEHMAYNALAALAVAYLSGACLSSAVAALEHLTPQEGRGRVYHLKHPSGFFMVIDDSYNANPVSMKAALNLLKDVHSSAVRRVAVLGDMLELGTSSEKIHLELLPFILDAGIDHLFFLGSHMKILAENIPQSIGIDYCITRDELILKLIQFIQSGDVILVKASHSMGFSQVVQAIQQKFPSEN